MTVTLNGEIVSPESTTDLEQRLMGASALPFAEREALITSTLEWSAQMLALVSQATDPARFASAGKKAAEMAAQYAKRLDVSKDMVLDAQVQQRRWERVLGVAIREGQARGEIADRSSGSSMGALRREAAKRGEQADLDSISLPSAKDYFANGTDGHQTYAVTDGTTDADFMEALSDARDEGNVSRANVVRKIKEAKGAAPAEEPTRKGDKRRAAKQTKVIGNIIFELNTFGQILNELADAGLDPAITDEEARDIIASLDGFTRATGRIKKPLN